jgi:hypothetical protein
MRFQYTLSFEHDVQPVDTLRGTVEAADFEEAVRRAVFRACSGRPNTKRPPRSLVVVLEAFDRPAPKRVNKTGPLSEPSKGATPCP